MDQKAYKEEMAAQLNIWSAQITALEARIKQANTETKLRRAEEMHDLRVKRRLACEKMNALNRATGEAWQHASRAADRVLADLKTGVNSVHSKFM